MRIIKEKTLTDYCKVGRYILAAESLKAWAFEIRYSTWNNASVLSSKRVVFNIKGNDYRLIVDIEYRLKIVFVVWFGTHAEYNKIDAKTVRYEN
jgi:mRNA interferase HigB